MQMQPIEFPTNYPGEAFYQLAEAAMEANNGRNDAIGTFALEATFNAEESKNRRPNCIWTYSL